MGNLEDGNGIEAELLETLALKHSAIAVLNPTPNQIIIRSKTHALESLVCQRHLILTVHDVHQILFMATCLQRKHGSIWQMSADLCNVR